MYLILYGSQRKRNFLNTNTKTRVDTRTLVNINLKISKNSQTNPVKVSPVF